jgi:glycosyltransferase involved in cell wall biosynthesis
LVIAGGPEPVNADLGPVGSTMELTILMPCLNEALTVGVCVRKALAYMHAHGVQGEILVADNGSTDGSQALAAAAGARVISIEKKGYGAALIGGIHAAYGRFIIMGDADDSYDFSNLGEFLRKLRAGFDLVVGNRFLGGITPGAMPLLNRYLGNPLLSFIGRTLFSTPVGDFHCGIRGLRKEAAVALNLRATGMEFASEMIVKASLADLAITEIPTTLRPDGRQRPPHLRPWRDGWRHLRFMFLRSPEWLFLYPGMAFTVIGLLGAALLTIRPISILSILTLDINALLYFSILAIVGVQITFFGLFAMAIAKRMQLNLAGRIPQTLLRLASHQGAVVLGLLLVTLGLAGAIHAVYEWGSLSFGELFPRETMRTTIPSVTILAIGTQLVFGGFLLGFIDID